MRIVLDTNVLISGVFFGGFPRKILSSIVTRKITACATSEIINEYEEIVQEMVDRKQGHINRTILVPLIKAMEIIDHPLILKYAAIQMMTNFWNVQRILMLYILLVAIKIYL